jgi:hypothetical protein
MRASMPRQIKHPAKPHNTPGGLQKTHRYICVKQPQAERQEKK